MAIKIGIFVCNTNQVVAVSEIIENYVHCPPYRKMKGMALFRLPLIEITILIASSNSRGYRYDIVYYDNNITTDVVHEVIFPICQWSRPKPLEYLLNKIEENKYV